jgi:hypothetical protein
LRIQTQADAVEMESGIIRSLCRAHAIPSATVRVITDTAEEDLPLDFNALLTADRRIHPGRLAVEILRSPCSLGELLRLRRRCVSAAARLSEVLTQACATLACSSSRVKA